MPLPGLSEMFPCGEGTYSDVIGSSYCKVCTHGSFPSIDKTECQKCPDNSMTGQVQIINKLYPTDNEGKMKELTDRLVVPAISVEDCYCFPN